MFSAGAVFSAGQSPLGGVPAEGGGIITGVDKVELNPTCLLCLL